MWFTRVIYYVLMMYISDMLRGRVSVPPVFWLVAVFAMLVAVFAMLVAVFVEMFVRTVGVVTNPFACGYPAT